MEQIHEPNKRFPIHDVVLSAPIVIAHNNFFIKYLLNNNPLYIQAPTCTTKQGIIKGGKQMYCDLLFTNENVEFIKWIEDLENYSQNYIYNNRTQWFESELEMHDIENSFTSPLKIFKSGKFYILRTNVPIRLGKCSLNLFDENEISTDFEKIKESTNIITILEFQGIKCSSRNFQIEIEIKQMMVLKETKMFEKCIIRSNKEDGTELFNFPPIRSSMDNFPTIIEDKQRFVISPEMKIPVMETDGYLGTTSEDIDSFSNVVEENLETKAIEDKIEIISEKKLDEVSVLEQSGEDVTTSFDLPSSPEFSILHPLLPEETSFLQTKDDLIEMVQEVADNAMEIENEQKMDIQHEEDEMEMDLKEISGDEDESPNEMSEELVRTVEFSGDEHEDRNEVERIIESRELDNVSDIYEIDLDAMSLGEETSQLYDICSRNQELSEKIKQIRSLAIWNYLKRKNICDIKNIL